MKNLAISVCLLTCVFLAGTAFADSACDGQIVVGHQGNTDYYAFLHDITIYSNNIPTDPGAKFKCTYEGHSGMQDVDHALSSDEFIPSLGPKWVKDGNSYTCNVGLDCKFVTQKK
jgi:hypothetical protein